LKINDDCNEISFDTSLAARAASWPSAAAFQRQRQKTFINAKRGEKTKQNKTTLCRTIKVVDVRLVVLRVMDLHDLSAVFFLRNIKINFFQPARQSVRVNV
jgi:hypothetical protein